MYAILLAFLTARRLLLMGQAELRAQFLNFAELPKPSKVPKLLARLVEESNENPFAQITFVSSVTHPNRLRIRFCSNSSFSRPSR